MIPASYAPREPPPESTMPSFGNDFAKGLTTRDCTTQLVGDVVVLGAMKLAALSVLSVLGLESSPAFATTFEEYGANRNVTAATSLYEAACDLDVKLDGSVATVTMKQRIVNAGASPMAA